MSNRMKKKQTYVKKHEFLHTYTSEVNDNSAYILEISISKITPKSSLVFVQIKGKARHV